MDDKAGAAAMKEAVSGRLRKAREETGLTVAEVELAAGLPATNYYPYECGEKLPGALRLAALSRVLHVSSDWILGLKGSRK